MPQSDAAWTIEEGPRRRRLGVPHQKAQWQRRDARLRDAVVPRRRQAAQEPRTLGLQARRPRADLPAAHLQRFRGEAGSPAGRGSGRGGGSRRVPRRERVLGAQGGALVAPSGERQAARHRQADRRGHGGHRGGQPGPQGRVGEGLQPARPRQGHARRTHRPALGRGGRRAGRPCPGPARAGLRVLPRRLRRVGGQAGRRVLHPALRGARAGRDAGSTGRKAITPRGGWRR